MKAILMSAVGDNDVHVRQTFPLSQAKTAHNLIEQGHTIGKIVLSI